MEMSCLNQSSIADEQDTGALNIMSSRSRVVHQCLGKAPQQNHNKTFWPLPSARSFNETGIGVG